MPPTPDTAVRPYKIAVDDAQLEDLRERLSRTRLPDELDGPGWDAGTPLGDLTQILDYWQDKYDWRAAEKHLNDTLPQFVTTITVDGFEPLDIHFVHQRCTSSENAIPLIYVHGWPGCFYEASKIVRPLAEGGPGVPGFHVVVPSLPNWGFSDGVTKQGFSCQHHAEALHKLMLRLGYNQYATQGGDWGWAITRSMAVRYPDHVMAQHLNMDKGSPPKLLQSPLLAIKHALRPYTEAERRGLARSAEWRSSGMGYFMLQSTRPQTLAYALRDSPAALMAWVYEKLHSWADAYPWSHDELCTWISIYWFSKAGPHASVRLYYEIRQNSLPSAPPERKAFSLAALEAPPKGGRLKIGLSHFPNDLTVLPSTWTRTQGNVVFERSHTSGGHFPAWEKPELLVKDLRDMFGTGSAAAKAFKNTKL